MAKIINLREKCAYDLEGITSITQLHEGDRLNFGSHYRTILAVLAADPGDRIIRTGAEMPGDAINVIDYQLAGKNPITIFEIYAWVVVKNADGPTQGLYKKYSKMIRGKR